MRDESWAIRAVETAALSRARQQLERELVETGPTMAGLTVAQILWLRADYQLRTGKLASEIDPNGVG